MRTTGPVRTGFVYQAPPTIIRFMQSDAFGRLLCGPVGCTPGDTEFLTPTGWRRMDAYVPGDKVAVWDPTTKQTHFECAEYISLPATQLFLRFDSGSLVMELSPEHTMPYYDYRGEFKTTLAHTVYSKPSRRTIPCVWGNLFPDAFISDDEIRLRVAFAADGHVPPEGQKVRIVVRKQRKVDRLRLLLSATRRTWSEASYRQPAQEIVFQFYGRELTRSLEFVWGLSQRQLAIVLDECLFWDGLANHTEKRFYTSDKSMADAVQYAAHSCGFRATIHPYDDPRNKTWARMYNVLIRTANNQKNRPMVRAETVLSRVNSSDGRKYCFTTSTGFFIARCKNTIFITGNSGKTTGCLVELARRMGQQLPGQDGRRYTRFAIIRQTLKDAKATVLKDARGWFGAMSDWRVSESTLYIDFGDIYSEWMFVPLEDAEDLKRLLSTQLTGAYVNEASETDISLLSDIAGRCGRYPNNEFGACSWRGIFADTNMPIVDTPWADFIQRPPNEWQVFRQPGGDTLEAENLNHLDQTPETMELADGDPIRHNQGRNYYKRLMAVGTPDYIRRFVKAEFGRDPSGTAVFAESFRLDFHTVDMLEPIYGRMLLVGQDFGRNPWSLICQLDHKGRLLVLEEVAGTSIGLEQHVRQNLIPVLTSERYRGRSIGVVGDPSGIAMDSLFELNAFDLLKSAGLPAERAPTNNIDPRLRAVEAFFVRQVDGGGAILIDRSRCPILVQGLNGGYRYQMTATNVERNLPDKNRFSHVCDDLQYVSLVAGSVGAYQFVVGRVLSQQTKRPPIKRVSNLAWT